MSEPIINPAIFYWIGVSSSARTFFVITVGSAICVFITAALVISMEASLIKSFPYSSEGNIKTLNTWKKILKYSIIVIIISGLLCVFIPSRETLLSILVAKYLTYENAAWTLESVKEAVNYIVDAVAALK